MLTLSSLRQFTRYTTHLEHSQASQHTHSSVRWLFILEWIGYDHGVIKTHTKCAMLFIFIFEQIVCVNIYNITCCSQQTIRIPFILFSFFHSFTRALFVICYIYYIILTEYWLYFWFDYFYRIGQFTNLYSDIYLRSKIFSSLTHSHTRTHSLSLSRSYSLHLSFQQHSFEF